MQYYKFWNFRFAVFWLVNIDLPLSQKPKEKPERVTASIIQILKFWFAVFWLVNIHFQLFHLSGIGISFFFKNIILRYFLKTLLLVLSDSLYGQKWLTERSLKVNLFKIAVISETTRYIPLTQIWGYTCVILGNAKFKLLLLRIPNGKRIWFWYKTAPAAPAPADANYLRIRKQSKNSA